MMMTGAVAASLLGGCGSSTASTTETAVTDDAASTQAPQTDVEDEKESKGTDSPAQQTPASDFKTKVKDDGTIEDGVETIEDLVFQDCTSLEKVIIPPSVTQMDEHVFHGSKNVTIIAEPGSYAESYGNEQGIPVQNP